LKKKSKEKENWLGFPFAKSKGKFSSSTTFPICPNHPVRVLFMVVFINRYMDSSSTEGAA